LAFVGGPIKITRNLLHTELPIFFIATVHFVLALWDGTIDRIEAGLLTATLGAYLWYTLSSKDVNDKEALSTEQKKLKYTAFVFAGLGIAAVLVGAHYTVEMAVNIATGFDIPIGLVSIAAIAIGTSLPELFVSLQAVKSGDTELAIGNIFGSNAFNALLVIGIPGLISPLQGGEVVMQLGLGVMIAASLILFVSGLARQVHRWEGLMLLIFFVFFLVKLTEFI
jgi:cation:H+ antiporter